MEFINALLIYPGEPPKLVLIENSYASICGTLGGKASGVHPWSDNTIALFRPDGELNRLPPNRMVIDDRLRAVERVYGPLLLCAVDSKGERLSDYAFCSMKVKQALKYQFKFSTPDIIEEDSITGKTVWKVFYQNIETQESEE